jgi:Spy/CpxP family protein refolding chaperone
MTRPIRPTHALAIVCCAVLLAAGPAAQRGGGGGGRGGGGGMSPRSRLAILTDGFTLDKDQKDAVKKILDAAYKSAEPARKSLEDARDVIGDAIRAGKSQTEIDQAVAGYAAQSAAMTAAEMQALADVLHALTEEQRANQPAVEAAFYMMRGAFVDKKWDMVPGSRSY